MKQNETITMSKKTEKYFCETCDFNTSNKTDFTKHIATRKHKNCENEPHLKQNETKNVKNSQKYTCACGVILNSRTTLWRHKKTCTKIQNEEQPISSNLIMELIKDNKDMKQFILEQNNAINNTIINLVKNGINSNVINTNSMNNNSNNNNNNKTFNLQFFLNETCKNAMNMSEFIETIKIQLPDLEKMGEIGYVQGLSDIINNNLKTLDITQRPVHCTDQKRETIYIKNDNMWEKEDDNKTKLRKAITKISFKNIKVLPQFREKYPDYHNSSLKISDTYDKLVLEAMGGGGNDEIQKENKIIHNISKCITIDSSIKHSA